MFRKLALLVGLTLALVALFLGARRIYYYHYYYPAQMEETKAKRQALKDAYYADANHPGEILFVGNSLTEQFNLNHWFQQSNIKNRGIGGNTTTDILNRLDEITESQPKMILLMAGINDLPSQQLDTVLSNYQLILQRIRQATPQTQVYLQSVLPVSIPQASFINQQVAQLNNQLVQWSPQYSMHYIDIHQAFMQQPKLQVLYQPDGLHLNHAGYRVWADVLLQDVFQQPNRPAQ